VRLTAEDSILLFSSRDR